MPYVFTLKHISGVSNRVSDALSCYPTETPDPNDPEIVELNMCRAVYNDPLLETFREATSLDKNYQLVLQALRDKKEVGNLPAWHPGTALKNQWNHLSIDHENLVLFESRRL